MKSKEKALELVKIFSKKSNNLKQRTDWNYDKQCALIAVDEIIQTYHSPIDDKQIQGWQEVKKEIEKL